MERYSEYKDSGVKWLGEIPSHWGLRKMKYTFDERSQKGFPNEPLLAATQNHGVILKSQYENRTVEAVKSLDTLKLVEIGDFVISLRSFQGGLEYAHNRGIISPAYTILTPTHIKASYFKHLSKSDIFISLLKSSVTGIREGQNIDYNKLKESLLPIPSEEEQKAMGCYLDAATSKIDKAIAMQQKMIDLLNERKQIIIQNAVTKGLDDKVEMKDSGVECFGLIPSHWKVIGWNHIFENLDKLREPISAEQRSRNNPKYDYYGASGVIDKIDYYNVDDKVLLIGEDGANLKMRNLPLVYKASGKIWVNNHAHILKPKVDSYDYMAYLMELFDYNPYITGSAQPKLSQEQLGTIRLCVPPIDEQNKIAIHLNRHLHGFDSAITNCQRQIALLQERKQIIINEVVTGKVKVS